MSFRTRTGLVGLLFLLPCPALAQGPEIRPFPLTVKRNQVTLDAGLLSLGLAYARRIGAGPWSLGAGLWWAWEPRITFKQNIYEPLGAEFFARYQPLPLVQLEAGPSVARYFWADDCGECTGTFVGGRASALIGYRVVFLGPSVRFGRANGGADRLETGLIWVIQARLALGWGR